MYLVFPKEKSRTWRLVLRIYRTSSLIIWLIHCKTSSELAAAYLPFTETEMSSFWWNLHHWLHCKLSKWQLPMQPVIKISSKWRHFRFSVFISLFFSSNEHHNFHFHIKWYMETKILKTFYAFDIFIGVLIQSIPVTIYTEKIPSFCFLFVII